MRSLENHDFLNFFYLSATYKQYSIFLKGLFACVCCSRRAVSVCFMYFIQTNSIRHQGPHTLILKVFWPGQTVETGIFNLTSKRGFKVKVPLLVPPFKDIKNSALSGKRSVIAKRKRASFDVENKLACLLNCVLNLLFKHFLTASQEWKNNDDGSYFMHLFSQTIGIIHCWA